MTLIQLFWLLLGSSWAILEFNIARKTRVPCSETYRSEKRIWLVVVVALIIALLFKHWQLVKLPIAYLPRQAIALIIFSSGLALRFHAIVVLGRFFSTTATTQHQHNLIEKGAYQYIRHPAYTGLLISFFAAGFAMGDVLAMLSLLCPIGYVLNQRIETEEQLLTDYFGQVYYDYCQRTKKLIPWIF